MSNYKFSILTPLLIMVLTANAFAQLPELNPDALDSLSSETLLQKSFDENRGSYRHYLAKYRASSPQGLFGKAWTQDTPESTITYKELLRRFPDSGDATYVGLINLMFEIEKKTEGTNFQDTKEYYELAMRKAPYVLCYRNIPGELSEKDWTLFKSQHREFFDRHPLLLNLQEAKANLFVRKDYAAFRKKYTQLYEGWNNVPRLPLETLAHDVLEWEISHTYFPERSYDDRVNAVIKWLKHALENSKHFELADRNRFSAWVYREVADQLHKLDSRHRKFRNYTKQFYEKSLSLYPNGDVAWSLATMLDDAYNPGPSGELLETLNKYQNELVTSPSFHRARARLLLKLNRHEDASKAYKRSLSIQFDDAQRLATAKEYAWGYWMLLKGNRQAASQLIEPFTRSSNPNVARTARTDMANLSSNALDLRQADYWNQEYKKSKDINLKYYLDRKEDYKKLKAILSKRDQYFSRNPFHLNWFQKFGLQGIVVHFDKESSRISSRTQVQIDSVKDSIPDSHRESVVLTLLGQRISSEPTELAIERAEAVSTKLIQALDLKPSQIQIRTRVVNIGKSGSDYSQELQRRVEIHIGGDLDSPVLTAATGLPDELKAISPDGSMAIFEDEVWDVEKRIRLFRLSAKSNATFSPNGLWIASCFITNGPETIIITDVHTGVPVLIHASPTFGLNNLKWSPNGEMIAIANFQGGPEPNGFSVINASDGQHIGGGYTDNSTSHNLEWLANGRMLAVLPWAAYRTPVFSTTSWQLVKELDEMKYAHSITSDPNGNTLLIGDDTSKVHIYDVENAFQHKSYDSKVASKSTLEVHPTKPLVLMNHIHGTAPEIRCFNFATLDEVGVWKFSGDQKTDSTTAIARWIKNGDRVLINSKEFGYRDFTQSLDEWVPFKTSGELLTGKAAFSELGMLVTVDGEGTHVWDITNGRKVHRWKGAGFTYLGRIEGTDSFLVAKSERANHKTTLIRFSLDDFSQLNLSELGNFNIQKYCVRNSSIILGGTEFSGAYDSIATGQLRVISIKTGELINKIEVSMVTEALQNGKLYQSNFRVLAVTNDTSEAMVVTEWEDGKGWRKTSGKQLRFFNLRTGEELDDQRFNKSPVDGFYEGDGQYRLSFSTGRSDSLYSRHDHEFISAVQQETRRPQQLRGFDEKLDDAFQKQNLRVEVTDTNEIKFYRRNSDELALTILNRTEGRWLAATPVGDFASSLGGDEQVYWRVGTKLLPLDALKAGFERPNVIKEQLDSIAEGKAQVQSTSKIDSALFSIPYKMILMSDPEIETDKGTYEILVEIERTQKEAPEPKVEFVHNGRIVIKDRGKLKLTPFKTGAKTVFKRVFSLEEGLNLIEARIVYNEARVLPVSARVISKKVATAAVAPQLWFFGVGVSEYENEGQNLNYAHADAKSVASAFQKQEGQLYSKVNTLVLTNKNATSRNIQVEMIDFLERASSQDVVVIFLAGHGAKDSRENLYFIPHDGLLEKPRTGMDIAFFSKALTQRPENQKALFLIDICHSGATSKKFKARGRVVSEELIKRLSEGTGTIVLASSTGAQSSFEDKSFGGGHGAFSFAILEGLAGQADLVKGDNAITVNELTAFVCRRVPEMTDQGQHPTTPNAYNVRDFPLATK